MNNFDKYLLLLALYCLPFAALQAQNAIPATGGTATGSGGTVTYTIGQVTYNTYIGTNGSVAQGVQQPYEISVITSTENTDDVSLDYMVYPNPTSGLLKLMIKPFDNDKWSVRLYDLNGVLLQDKKVVSNESEITLEGLPASVYFLKITNGAKQVKVYKIIKK